MIDKNNIKAKLINQGYTERNASIVADEMMKLLPELVPCLEGWMLDKSLDYESNGYSIMGLVKDRHMNYPAALLTMDWLIKEPEKALHSLKRGVR